MNRNATYTRDSIFGDTQPLILSADGYGAAYPAAASPAVPAAAGPGSVVAVGPLRSDWLSSPATGMVILFALTAYFVARRDRWG